MARISPLVLLPPVAFAALAGLFLGGMFRDDPDALPSTLEGRAAPALELTSFGDEAPPSLSEIDGVKLVNFWASWCGPCRIEHPQLMALQAEGIPIVGVNYKDDPDNALRFLAELGDPYSQKGTDARGRVAIEWGVYGVPETFVIDQEGTVVLRFAGPITEAIMASRINPAIEAAR
jgi:cytochrome c biogenesis protein CcmG/thiol:disulfide interchange protein DsbE